MKPGEDFVPDEDITVVREFGEGDALSYGAVTDADELYAVARELEAMYGHLEDDPQG